MKSWMNILLFGLITSGVVAQTTPDAAVSAALRNHPLVKAATFEVQAKKYAEKTALKLPNPEVNAESPTGEFYALGVLQSFEFPTVYARQKQVAQAETALAQTGQRVSENDLRYTVRSLYLEVQVAEHLVRQWKTRDSLYQAIAAAAVRQFGGGEIDVLQKMLAENEAGAVHQERLAAEQNALVLRQQLATITGLSDVGTLLPLGLDSLGATIAANIANNPSVAFEQQSLRVAEKQVGLAKSLDLPSFSVGYLNQGARTTPLDYRFRVTVGIPLWVGQYRAGRQNAESQAQAAQSRAEGQLQAVELEMGRTQTEAATALQKVRYHELQALPRSRSLIAAALRMREAGQVDYVTFLRTLDQAFAIQREHAAQVQSFETARIKLLYLVGQ